MQQPSLLEIAERRMDDASLEAWDFRGENSTLFLANSGESRGRLGGTDERGNARTAPNQIPAWIGGAARG